MEDPAQEPQEPFDFTASMRAAEAKAAGESQDPPAAPEGVEGEGTAPEGGGDDRLAALEKQLADAQAMIGRQSQEIGQLRTQSQPQVDEWEDEAPILQDDEWGQLETLYERQGGAGMMLYLANNHPELIDHGIALWKENDYRNAELYEKQMNRIAESALAETRGPDPTLARLASRDAQEAAQRTISQEFGLDQLKTLQPHFEEAFNSMPDRLQEILVQDFESADEGRVTDAYRTLLKLAAPLAGGTAAQAAADQRAAATRAGKQAATAATGSQAPVGQRESGSDYVPTTREELEALDPDDRKRAAAKIMSQRILAQRTSVSAGLSKGE